MSNDSSSSPTERQDSAETPQPSPETIRSDDPIKTNPIAPIKTIPSDQRLSSPETNVFATAPEKFSLLSTPNLAGGMLSAEREPLDLLAGERLDDFLLRRELGRGAFGVVYLAEQLSLKRTVALKITDASRGDGCDSEGETMAQLDHPSIVRVYSQSSDKLNQRRILCMQFVAGLSLRRLMFETRTRFGNDWEGPQLLEILDQCVDQNSVTLSETSWQDRAVLERSDQLATICWFGSEIAFALDHAHQAGYVHRDVKPDNTIVTTFGRPMLVDFNLAAATADTNDQFGGGTVEYMSPQSLTGFRDGKLSKTESVFAADIYATGVMLWELATGTFPFKSFSNTAIHSHAGLQELIESRKILPQNDQINPRLAECLRRAIHPEADHRFASGRELAEALQGVKKQVEVLKTRSSNRWLSRTVLRRPILWLLIAAFLPHTIATVFQIAYNQAEIVSRLTPKAGELFYVLIFWVNPILYGICGACVAARVLKLLQPWFALNSGSEITEDQASQSREQLLRLPKFFALLGALGWLSGATAFPITIYWMAERFSSDVWLHFLVSFAISGAIAITFSYTLTLAVIVYAIYPTCFATPLHFAQKSASQLGPLRNRWSTLPILAGAIPLSAAILVIANVSPAELMPTTENGYREIAFKGLVIGLILASAFGFELVRRTGHAILRLIDQCVNH